MWCGLNIGCWCSRLISRLLCRVRVVGWLIGRFRIRSVLLMNMVNGVYV